MRTRGRFTSGRHQHRVASAGFPPPPQMSGRDISRVSPDEIADALRPHAQQLSFVWYAEDLNAKLDATLLVRHDRVLLSLRQLHRRLTFTKRQVTDALQILLQEKLDAGSWTLSEHDQEDWVKTMDLRLRSMCRHLAQAMLKNPPARWVEGMASGQRFDQQEPDAPPPTTPPPTVAMGAGKKRKNMESSGSAAESTTWLYGWDPEHERAWR